MSQYRRPARFPGREKEQWVSIRFASNIVRFYDEDRWRMGCVLRAKANNIAFHEGQVIVRNGTEEIGRYPADQLVSMDIWYGHAGEDPAYRVADIREHHPTAYRRWTEEEEQHLRRRHAEGATLDELAAESGRQPSAISSRLGIWRSFGSPDEADWPLG
ncbi:hypothetical protein GCM10022226_62100 [Sphaerisporangium flaviroseum]|uniref:Transposase IS30-like HTH domain-containing protein n=1 Tax=Sphaerisporangium flaviroseum TaxID=509199 RepID=A0ABP7J1L6_9ACTN